MPKIPALLILAALAALLLLTCRPPETSADSTVLRTTANQPAATAHASANVLTKGVPIDGSSGTPKTVLQVTIPNVNPGDMIRGYADANITNDTGISVVDGVRKVTGTRYTVGVSYHIAYAPVGGTPVRILTSLGENCDVSTHHLALNIMRMLEVPASWTPGADMVVMMRVDAHSSAWAKNGGGELLRVEQYGQIIVDHWTNA